MTANNNPHYDNTAIAKKIYESCLDMDYADFEDTRDEETDYIKQALDEIEKIDDCRYVALYNALGLIFDEI